MTNLHPIEIGTTIGSSAHAMLLVDGAGWHRTGSSLCLPELNPVESVWAFPGGNKLGHLVFDSYNAIADVCWSAWSWLARQPNRITMPGTRSWAQVTA